MNSSRSYDVMNSSGSYDALASSRSYDAFRSSRSYDIIIDNQVPSSVTVYHLPIIEPPVILTDPYKGSHVLKWNKSRGQPDTGRQGLTTSREQSFTMSIDDDDLGSNCTPYRLPRLSPRGDQSPNPEPEQNPDETKSPIDDKVWSRYGFEKIIRIPELGPQIRVLLPPPKSYVHNYRQSATPRFKHAAITPTVRSLPWNMGVKDVEDPRLQMYTTSAAGGHVHDDLASRSTRFEPTPTPISRSESPAKSVKSIHWILGHNRYHTFDKKGRSHKQGPFSREFQVTCMAPTNWLKMKWGRSKTMIH